MSVSIEVLGAELEARGHEVSYFAPRLQGFLDTRPNVYRFPSIRPPSMRDYPIALPWSGGLYKTFRNLKLDLVHTHTPFIVGTSGLLWGRRMGLPVVSTNHTLYTEYAHYLRWLPQPFTKMLVKRWMRWYYNGCGQVIVPSAMVGERLKSYGVITPWTAVPTGIHLPKEEGGNIYDLSVRHGIPAGSRICVYVGRVALEKNMGMLLKAFRDIQKQEPEVWLVIVGDGPYLEVCRGIADELRVSERIAFTGSLERNLLPGLLSQCSVFVFASLTETQGLVVGEAAACGVPAVAVNAGGVPEFVVDGQTGYLVGNDPSQFAQAVLGLLRDEGKRIRFSEAAKRFAAKFTTEEMTNDILLVYERAMEKKG